MTLVSKIWHHLFEARLGSLDSFYRARQVSDQQPDLEDAILAFHDRWPDIKNSCTSDPVFILAAGWRSGSTLLQRLLMSSSELLIWGEPYSQNQMIEQLSRPLRGITQESPDPAWFWNTATFKEQDLSDSWVANLYPESQYLLQAHAAFFQSLFESPASAQGYERWGVKEVRLDIKHAIYLQWIFPRAKFIFLYRNPYEAYKSYKGNYWYTRWPDKPVYTAKQFGKNWESLLNGYLDGHCKVQSLLLSFEELCEGGKVLKRIEDFLGIQIREDVLQKKISKPSNLSAMGNATVAPGELNRLRKAVDPLASSLGYQLSG